MPLLKTVIHAAELSTVVPSDEELAAEAVHDRAAFAELYRRYADRVYRYLLARTGSRDDAQELTAETFLSALQVIGRFRPGRFAAWLFGIARHQASHHFRRRQQTSLTADGDEAGPFVSVEALALDRLYMAEIVRLLGTLTPERAEALALFMLAELTPSEVAQVMGKSEPAVRMLVHRALRDLRRKLEKDG